MTESRASFKSFDESTRDDWAIISVQLDATQRLVADRILEQLRYLESDHGGFPVSRLEHSLQTTTRAERDGRDEEYLVCALLHDIGDTLAPYNHPQIGAAIVKPFVSDANHWMVEQHGIFQGYYFFHHLGLDRNLRDQYLGHEFYDHTATFCEVYDQTAFDPSYDTLPLEFFEPAVREILGGPRRSIYMRDDGAVMESAAD